MGNSSLTSAKKAKNDEFYTQFHDIQKEIESYLEFDPEVFRGKTVLLPCDDPEWSNFTKFFATNFERFGLKKLISTSYAPNSKSVDGRYQPTVFEIMNPRYDKVKTFEKGKIFTLTHDTSGDGRIDVDDLEWNYLDGDGDFRSNEIKQLRDESDIIVTNPPFSLFKEFLTWNVEGGKHFLLIGNMNAIGYSETFPLIKDNKIWLGVTNGAKIYITPEGEEFKMGNTCWFTNLDHGRRHQPLPLMIEKDILKFGSKKPFEKYENYNAIDIGFVKHIPRDYVGVMGVPISFLDKYNPEQFDIVGMCENKDIYNLKTKVYSSLECKEAYSAKFGKKGTYDLNAAGVVNRNGLLEKVYARILIKHLNPTK